MNLQNNHDKLKENIHKDAEKIEKAKKDQSSFLAQTVYLGTLGFIFILPVILGAYIGVWLDNRFEKYFSISWTISLILFGIFLGGMNVYLFIKRN